MLCQPWSHTDVTIFGASIPNSWSLVFLWFLKIFKKNVKAFLADRLQREATCDPGREETGFFSCLGSGTYV